MKKGSKELIGDIIVIDIICDKNNTDYGSPIFGNDFDGI